MYVCVWLRVVGRATYARRVIFVSVRLRAFSFNHHHIIYPHPAYQQVKRTKSAAHGEETRKA